MRSKELSAGDVIEARCTRCRAVTNHTIIAMVGEQPARVRCNTCDGDHNYRPPQKAAAAKTSRSTPRPVGTSAKKKLTKEQEQWQAATAEVEPGLAVPYDMERSFRVDEIVTHPVFGLGVVTAVFKPNKVEILFTGGKKMLRCRL
jgi:hypothetical protein